VSVSELTERSYYALLLASSESSRKYTSQSPKGDSSPYKGSQASTNLL